MNWLPKHIKDNTLFIFVQFILFLFITFLINKELFSTPINIYDFGFYFLIGGIIVLTFIYYWWNILLTAIFQFREDGVSDALITNTISIITLLLSLLALYLCNYYSYSYNNIYAGFSFFGINIFLYFLTKISI